MSRYPYIALISRGNHNHHPPYPTRLPQEIANTVIEAIKQGDCLALTPRMLRIWRAYA